MSSPIVKPLPRCPVCRYDLTGLPAAHRCPECGIEYDEMTRVWRVERPRWRRIALPITSFVLVALSGLGRLVGTAPQTTALKIIDSTVLLAVPAILVIWYLSQRRRPFVAVGRHGVTFRLAFRPVRQYPYESLKVSMEPLVLMIPGRLGRTTLRLPNWLTEDERDDLERHLRRCLRAKETSVPADPPRTGRGVQA